MGRILVVDDEALIVKGITMSLKLDSHIVDNAFDGIKALELAETTEYDCILLDVMLPGLSGYEVCKKIREKSNVPIIMLTARSEDNDKLEGLECGADDYITKPFNILEVRARIKAVIRRNGSGNAVNSSPVTTKKVFGDLEIDMQNRFVTIKGKNINLTAKEFEILALLLNNPNEVYSRERLMEILWNKSCDDPRTVDVHVRRLREKIEENPGEPKYIHTKWKAGYYFHD